MIWAKNWVESHKGRSLGSRTLHPHFAPHLSSQWCGLKKEIGSSLSIGLPGSQSPVSWRRLRLINLPRARKESQVSELALSVVRRHH